MCYTIYDKKSYELKKLYDKKYEDMEKLSKISKKDIDLLEKLLYKFRVINDGLGFLILYPIKDKGVLKYYFNFYNHYYKNLEDIPYDKILEVYNKYDYDISNIVKFLLDTKIKSKNLCFSLNFKKNKKVDFYKLKKHLIKLSKIKTPFYDLRFIKEDIKVINKLIEYKEKGYIIE